MAETLATLDGDADSAAALSVLVLKAAAKGEGRSADASRAALDKNTQWNCAAALQERTRLSRRGSRLKRP